MNKASMLLAVSAAALALTAAGCGGSGDAKAGSSGAKANASTDQGVKHAQCMRENGLPGYPDPGQDSGEKPNLPDRDSPEFKKAEQACQSLEPPENRPGTPENAELQRKMLKWAQCMRTNGVPNFPDPQNGKILIKPRGSIDGNSPQFKKAVQACRSLEVGGAKGHGG
ncbi:hypothetical protein [Spirillospora sp. CA-128828]|uniref:hypothetical protein n=1 Tax=Spirillospora sp. CA-128828 TaxID=3240033 RepID=UPI003D8CBB88